MNQKSFIDWALMGTLGCCLIALIGATVLKSNPDGTGSCTLNPGSICFHRFLSTDTTTTADTDVYQVDCPVISYKLDSASGTASILVKECSEQSTTGDCEVFACDFNGDGIIDAVDEGTAIDGDVGTRSCTRRPTSRWHWIDVQTVPSSGDARVTIICHNK